MEEVSLLPSSDVTPLVESNPPDRLWHNCVTDRKAALKNSTENAGTVCQGESIFIKHRHQFQAASFLQSKSNNKFNSPLYPQLADVAGLRKQMTKQIVLSVQEISQVLVTPETRMLPWRLHTALFFSCVCTLILFISSDTFSC